MQTFSLLLCETQKLQLWAQKTNLKTETKSEKRRFDKCPFGVMWRGRRPCRLLKREFDRIYQINFTFSQFPSPPAPRWFGRDIWKRYCYRKHTQRRLLCASRPRLTSPRVGKCTLSLTSWAFMVWGASAGYRLLSPLLHETLTAPQRPTEPHNSPIQDRVGVLTKFRTTQLVEPPSSSSAHQHPIPRKMGHLTSPPLHRVLLQQQWHGRTNANIKQRSQFSSDCFRKGNF